MRNFTPPPFEGGDHNNDRAYQLFALNFVDFITFDEGKDEAATIIDTWMDLYHNNRCDSPIENLLIAALLFTTNGYERFDVVGTEHIEAIYYHNEENAVKDMKSVVIPQFEIGKYRVDFLILTRYGETIKRLVVECDGHDFHERTKQQASRDKKRDREMARLGIPVLRFTGSDIYNKPMECAQEIGDFAEKQLDGILESKGLIAGRKKA